MGEALISRAGGGNGESETIVPSDQSMVILTVQDSSGLPLSNIKVNANDAGVFYNYTTNSLGQCLFTLKSGWANFNIQNQYSNGLKFADQTSKGWYNFEATLGKRVELTAKYDIRNSGNFSTNGNYTFLIKNSINVSLGGGSGGSGGSYTLYQPASYTERMYGGAGGGAQEILNRKLTIARNGIYRVSIGSQGASGSSGSGTHQNGHTSISSYPTSGKSGGTSIFNNISATGGGGGEAGDTGSPWQNGNDGTSYGQHYGAGYVKFT